MNSDERRARVTGETTAQSIVGRLETRGVSSQISLVLSFHMFWKVCFGQRRNLPMLLLSGNCIFYPASEPHISIYARSSPAVDFAPPPRSHFRKANFQNRANHTTIVPRIFAKAFQMIIEVAAVLFFIQIVSMISRLIDRRRDVLYYVSKPDIRR
jgi:hypothetical protein